MIGRSARPACRRAAVHLATCALLIGWLTGCGPSGQAGPCMPPEFSLSTTSAAVGQEIRVFAPAATCDPHYGQQAQAEIRLVDSTGTTVLRIPAPMADDGAFSQVITIPLDTAPGEAGVIAHPHGVDWCDDTGVNNRLSNPQSMPLRSSCVLPVRPLQVLPAP